ncbi:MAG TPA: CocE/NonD family hydrolase [Longimicrobiales bacterium]|nr:CocE/NonD family hydrolase [Longimicrobiales bacterium]
MTGWLAGRLRGLTLAVPFVIPAVPVLAQQPVAPVAVTQVVVEMPDGVALTTDIYLPAAPPPFPAVLVRTPYGAGDRSAQGEWFAARGYAAVLQNVRGTGGSGGAFVPLVNERADGLATVEWITRQSWSDGRVALWGGSYSGNAAFVVAAAGHPAVVAMAQLSGWADNRSFLYRSGAFQLLAQLPWVVQYAFGKSPAADAWDDLFRTTPMSTIFDPLQASLGALLVPFPYERVRVPVLHLTGLHDYVYRNTLEAYAQIRDASGGRVEQALVLGPWWHNQIWMNATTAGDEDFGVGSRWGFEPVMESIGAWFDRQLERGTRAERGPAVRVFVMGENRWYDLETWPPANVQYQPWYLGDNGTLGPAAPAHDAADHYIYDPADPVPTFGGAVSHFFPHLLGVRDQRALEGRADVRIYTSEPLTRPLILAGPVRAVIHASTDGPDTDFTAKLVEVRADGYARIIEEGIVRGLLRDGLDAPSPLVAGRSYAFEIDMGSTALRIAEGSRIRIEVSSSNFPQYLRNPNTGVDPMQATTFRVARQTVHHGPGTPSRVVLPVWREEEENR